MTNNKAPKPAINLQEQWNLFFEQEKLSKEQQERFEHYFVLLHVWNKKFNITAITDPKDIINDHFRDSLHLKHVLDLKTRRGICDVGTGGGFPGIPLKICYPDVPMVLIEVNLKKVQFLEAVIEALKLPKIEICTDDWRTFLRKTSFDLDLFVARASLPIEELLRLFKPSSPYKDSLLVYWAAAAWLEDKKTLPYVREKHRYKIDTKYRKLIFFTKSQARELLPE